MKTNDGRVITLWSADLFPAHHSGALKVCRFSPTCEARTEGDKTFAADHESCPQPALFAERVGGENLGGYERWIPLCRAVAAQRFGEAIVAAVEAGG